MRKQLNQFSQNFKLVRINNYKVAESRKQEYQASPQFKSALNGVITTLGKREMD